MDLFVFEGEKPKGRWARGVDGWMDSGGSMMAESEGEK